MKTVVVTKTAKVSVSVSVSGVGLGLDHAGLPGLGLGLPGLDNISGLIFGTHRTHKVIIAARIISQLICSQWDAATVSPQAATGTQDCLHSSSFFTDWARKSYFLFLVAVVDTH